MSLVPGLLAVHAHPDDEVISTGGVLARAMADGRRAKVLTCTDGKRGEIVGVGMDADLIRPRLAEVRAEEIAAALEALGGPEHEFLGYADSDMMGRDGNYDPTNFWQANLHEAVGRVVRVIREFKPTVLVTYDAFGGYGHPDHIQAHRVTLLAAEAAAMKVMYPETGVPWRTPKLYFAAIPKSAIAEANQMFIDRGLPSPFGESTDPEDIPMGVPDELITTEVDVRGFIDVKRTALLAHVSQIAPDSFFMNVPDDMMDPFYGTETFVRRYSDVDVPEGRETDLFAGVD